uniref:Dynamin N-terminal domain-containing protein n=1 Tax=Magallana gigas TaxID=29159 RepID=A0A8W8NLK6_MAGGI
MDATNAGKEETPCNDFDETLDLEKRLSKQFEEVLKLIQEDAFWNNVGEGIEKTYPEIKKLLKERMKDLEKRDCEIVVAGETNAGKSTLINKLIGHDALTTGILETTGTIYRVMHSEKSKRISYWLARTQ